MFVAIANLSFRFVISISENYSNEDKSYIYHKYHLEDAYHVQQFVKTLVSVEFWELCYSIASINKITEIKIFCYASGV